MAMTEIISSMSIDIHNERRASCNVPTWQPRVQHHTRRMLSRISSEIEWLGVCRRLGALADTDQPIDLDRVLQAYKPGNRPPILVAIACGLARAVAWIDCWNGRMECVSSSKKALEGDDRDSRLGTSRLFSSRFALALACSLARMDGWIFTTDSIGLD